MAVTADSTDAQVNAELENAADYDLQDSDAAGIAKAKLFIHAGRILLNRLRAAVAKGDKSLANDLKMRAEQVEQAQSWLRATAANAGGGGGGLVTHPDMTEFRG